MTRSYRDRQRSQLALALLIVAACAAVLLFAWDARADEPAIIPYPAALARHAGEFRLRQGTPSS